MGKRKREKKKGRKRKRRREKVEAGARLSSEGRTAEGGWERERVRPRAVHANGWSFVGAACTNGGPWRSAVKWMDG